MGAVAVVAHDQSGPAFVLGAILAPTDPVVATSGLRCLGGPDRIASARSRFARFFEPPQPGRPQQLGQTHDGPDTAQLLDHEP